MSTTEHGESEQKRNGVHTEQNLAEFADSGARKAGEAIRKAKNKIDHSTEDHSLSEVVDDVVESVPGGKRVAGAIAEGMSTLGNLANPDSLKKGAKFITKEARMTEKTPSWVWYVLGGVALFALGAFTIGKVRNRA